MGPVLLAVGEALHTALEQQFEPCPTVQEVVSYRQLYPSFHADDKTCNIKELLHTSHSHLST